MFSAKAFAAFLILFSSPFAMCLAQSAESDPVELEYPNLPRLLTPREAIHAEDRQDPEDSKLTPIQRAIKSRDKIFDNMVSVGMEIVINENGRVDSAKPVSGPDRFYEQAQDIEMHRAYAPARVDGNIVRAKFQDFVSVYPLERWAEKAVLFPETPDLSTLKISLKRTGCLGSCPGYTVTISGSGEVSFDSCDECYVAVPGTHMAHIPQQAVLDLVEHFRAAKFLSALDNYECNWTDMPSQTLTLSINGIQKTVIDYGGSVVGLPDEIESLEAIVDKVAGTDRWVSGNAETLYSLQREHWNFASTSSQNIGLFNTAILRRDAELVRAFISAKAPILATNLTMVPPVCNASSVGDRDLVQQMLALHPDTRLSADVTDECLSLAAHSGQIAVAQLWLSRGARATLPLPPSEDADDPKSNLRRRINPPLLAAIQSGNPDMVALLLHAHANVSSRFNRQRSLPAFALASSPSEDDKSLKRMLSLLVEAGADVNEETDDDRPAIFEIGSHPGVIPLLLHAGASPNQTDSTGKTPLMINAYFEDAVAALLKAGADPALKAPDGTTALSAARAANCKACVTLIEEALKSKNKSRHPPYQPNNATSVISSGTASKIL